MSGGTDKILNGCFILVLIGLTIIISHFFRILEMSPRLFWGGLGMMTVGGAGIILTT